MITDYGVHIAILAAFVVNLLIDWQIRKKLKQRFHTAASLFLFQLTQHYGMETDDELVLPPPMRQYAEEFTRAL